MSGFGLQSFVGLALVLLALADLFVTAVSLHGAGIVASPTARTVGKAVRSLPGRSRRWSGSVALVSVVLLWLALLWSGWAIVFHDVARLLPDPDGEPIGWLGAFASRAPPCRRSVLAWTRRAMPKSTSSRPSHRSRA